MDRERTIITATIEWRGITLTVTYEPHWLGIEDEVGLAVACLRIEAIAPRRAPLPITQTGYRSHFTSPDVVAAAGGHVAFVIDWLDEAAKSPKWRALEATARQLSLF